ncbi:MAG: HAMP domain-containing histidine kinase [Muribaculaceae bacterium]|nr:HAMP domain-containing histidine kinase [Muribaculaceae bacterium]
MRHIVLFLIIALIPGLSLARIKADEDSLYSQLAKVKTPADSLAILTNLYDLLPRAKSNHVGMQAIDVARRANDQAAALDIIRNQANRYMRSDSLLKILKVKTMEWPESEDRRETLTFITLMDNMRKGRYGDEAEREKFLGEILTRMGEKNTDDEYDHIELLHGVCMLLSVNSSSEILTNYMDSLGALVRRLPATSFAIRNAYNVHASTAYSTLEPKKSIDSDMSLIKNVERLEKYYHDRGRVYRNYDATYYTIYTRMLSNYEYLTPAQVEDFYSQAMNYHDKDSAILKTYESFPAPDIYYSMYHHDYAKAAKLLQNSEIPAPRRLAATRKLMLCADSLGNAHLFSEASKQYINLLEHELKERTHGSFRELQVAYSLYDMKHHLGQLEKERAEGYARIQRFIIMGSFVILVILVILVIMLMNKSRKNKEMAVNLRRSNDLFRAESESLRISREESVRARTQAEKANNLKSDFIKNMSYEVKVPLQAITEYSRLIADCVEVTGTKHIARFADMLELNSELLSTIINDVLRLSEMESSPSMPIHSQVVNVQTLCMATIEAMKHRVKPGVSLSLDPASQRVDMFTDPARVQQILNNLLTNAAKFTSKGSIILSYKEDLKKDVVEFSVTDTGIGINAENREKIFDRFVKLDRDTQGAGLGLTISRIIARRLGGDIKLDTSYPGPGSRFVLILPKKTEK